MERQTREPSAVRQAALMSTRAKRHQKNGKRNSVRLRNKIEEVAGKPEDCLGGDEDYAVLRAE